MLEQIKQITMIKNYTTILILFFGINFTAFSQITFDNAQINPFGLSGFSDKSNSSLGDIDNDGDLDIISAQLSAGGMGPADGIYFYENIGTSISPSFSSAQLNSFSLSGTEPKCSASLGDLDNDGDLDLLCGLESGGFLYYENIGTISSPSFSSPISNPFNMSFVNFYTTSALVDLDNDGDLDVMAGTYNGSFFFIENIGSASSPNYDTPVVNPFGLSSLSANTTLEFVDLDTDGDMDIMASDYGGYPHGVWHYIENTGTASTPNFTSLVTNPFSITAITGYFAYPCFGDLDADGDMDLLGAEYGTGSPSGAFYYFENTTNISAQITFDNVQINPFGLSGFSDKSNSSLGDIDNDGDLDIISAQLSAGGMGPADGIYFYENIGTSISPSFSSAQLNSFSLSGTEPKCSASLGDLDNDGDLDLLCGLESGGFLYYENIGTISSPSFSSPISNPFNMSFVNFYTTSALVDLDNDGDLDVMAGTYNGSFFFIENIGSASSPNYDTPVVNPFGLSSLSANTTLEFVDLDTDGDMDIMASDYGGYPHGVWHYIENTGTASTPNFTSLVTNPFSITAITGYFAYPCFGDLDADGDMDLLGAEYGTGSPSGAFYYFENTTITNTLGIIETSMIAKFVLYPNPATTFINISGLTKEEKYVIYNVLGEKVIDGTISDNDKIDIQNMTNGLYFLKIENQNAFQFIKQ